MTNAHKSGLIDDFERQNEGGFIFVGNFLKKSGSDVPARDIPRFSLSLPQMWHGELVVLEYDLLIRGSQGSGISHFYS